MSDSPKVQIFILTRNRPEYIVDCLQSVLLQTYTDLEVIVSDNSTNDATEKILRSFIGTPKFTYRKRQQSYNVYDHFNLCLSESSRDYVMLFHDDDTLEPEAIALMADILKKNSEISAVSTNSLFINSNGQKTSIFNKSLIADTILSSPKDLILGFFSTPMLITPFSSYLYRRTSIQSLQLLYKEGRKHADVSFLAKVARSGKIYWIAKELMNYRIHGNNDSGIFDIKAIFSLCRFLKKMNSVPEKLILDFKVRNILAWQKHRLSGRACAVSAKVQSTLRKYAFFYLIKRPVLLCKSLFRCT